MESLQKGDIVTHPARPEWGEGKVVVVQATQSNGQRAQKVTVDFPNHGRATIHTAQVPLKPANARQAKPAESSGGGWLAQLEAQREGRTGQALTDLPEAWTDPFRSRKDRLRDILSSYRFSKEPRSLIDWAVAQTGEQDPLAERTRHELEQAFQAWEHGRAGVLANLLREMHRNQERDAIAEVMKRCESARARQHVHEMLRRL